MICLATIQVGAQQEEHSTFVCQLERGHEGPHVEVGDMKRGLNGADKRPYTVSWQGDDREKCEFCQNLESDLPLCGRCNRFICRECHGQKETYDGPCRACKDEPEGKHGQ